MVIKLWSETREPEAGLYTLAQGAAELHIWRASESPAL